MHGTWRENDLSKDKGKIIDFKKYKEKRDLQKAAFSQDLSDEDNDFSGSLTLNREACEMIIYCLRLTKEFFLVERELLYNKKNEKTAKELAIANGILDMMHHKIFEINDRDSYVFVLSLTELGFILDCIEMAKSAFDRGINIFQCEPDNLMDYKKWLDSTFTYLLYVYTKWRFLQGK